jgi:hypothetical protein
MVRTFFRTRGHFKCPECRRYLTLTTSGVWACFYADSHEGEAVLYDRQEVRCN